MEDERIIALYWARDEDAIAETSSKYGKLCHLVAANILSSREDSEECVNDTYLGLWNAIPAQRPSRFSVFASRITRNLALKRFEYLSAAKRNPETVCSLEELGDCVSGKETIESELENRRLEQTIDNFFVAAGRGKTKHIFATVLVLRFHRSNLPLHRLQSEQGQIHAISHKAKATELLRK